MWAILSLVCALAVALLTLLGAAGERRGMKGWLKINTAQKRTHSLIRQGQEYDALIPNMREQKLVQLIERLGELVAEPRVFRGALGFCEKMRGFLRVATWCKTIRSGTLTSVRRRKGITVTSGGRCLPAGCGGLAPRSSSWGEAPPLPTQR